MSINLSNIKKQESIAVKNVVLFPVDKAAFYGYNVAVPAKGLLVVNSTIEVMGWIVGKTLVNAIEIVFNNKVVESIPVNTKRQDLVKHYGNLAEKQNANFGFHQVININFINGKSELLFQAVFSQSGKMPIAKVQFESFKPNSLMKPDFIIIGAMKAATSAIYDYLLYHPRVIPRQPKELHFFSYNYDKGLDWYLSNFAAKSQKSDSNNWLIGEASPSYLNVKEVPFLMKETCPDVKLIVSLRNPTDRAISQYYHHVKRVGDETRSIEEAFSEHEISKAIEVMPKIESDKGKLHQHITKHGNTAVYLLLSQYASQLKNWLKYFSREQFLILNYHDLENQPQFFVQQVFDFLNLQDYPLLNIQKVYNNKYPSTQLAVIKRLNAHFKQYNEELSHLVNIKF